VPLLEINQTPHISASVRLDESTAELVDQYAVLIDVSADDVVDKALNNVFSEDRDFQEFLKTPLANQVASGLRVRRGPNKMGSSSRQRSLEQGWSPRLPFGYRSHDYTSNFGVVHRRCFASG
jgi:hypothetical protein